jgi:pimeloyl-ACP methyl ester carboxylesterase
MTRLDDFTLQHQFIDLDYADQPYRAAYFQVGEGPLLVFLHGFLGSGLTWRSLLPYLHRDYQCICIDLLGFGQSAKPQIRYDIATLVTFMRQALDILEIEPYGIVGHSLGGWVAVAYALAYPGSVQGLMLVAPAGIRDDSFCGRYDALRPLLWQTPLVDVGLAMAAPVARVLGQAATFQQLRRWRQELQQQPAARSFLVERLRPEDAIDTVEQHLYQLQLPVLVVAGDRDDTIPLWHCQTYATEIPNAQLVVIPNGSHALPQDHAPELAQALRVFTKGLNR